MGTTEQTRHRSEVGEVITISQHIELRADAAAAVEGITRLCLPTRSHR
jgi:hypothetical protein